MHRRYKTHTHTHTHTFTRAKHDTLTVNRRATLPNDAGVREQQCDCKKKLSKEQQNKMKTYKNSITNSHNQNVQRCKENHNNRDNERQLSNQIP